MGNILRVVVVAALIWYGFTRYQAAANRSELASQVPDSTISAVQAQRREVSAFQCDGRTHCSQMTSCAEATYFINHCPGTKMDGNNDGVPCESQWCR